MLPVDGMVTSQNVAVSFAYANDECSLAVNHCLVSEAIQPVAIAMRQIARWPPPNSRSDVPGFVKWEGEHTARSVF